MPSMEADTDDNRIINIMNFLATVVCRVFSCFGKVVCRVFSCFGKVVASMPGMFREVVAGLVGRLTKESSERKLPSAYVSYDLIPRELAYCKKVESMLHDAIHHLPNKQTAMAIVVPCLQKTRPVEDLDGALEDFTDDELPRIYFVYIMTDDRYFLKEKDIPADATFSRYKNTVKIYNYSTESKGKEVIDNLSKDLASANLDWEQ